MTVQLRRRIVLLVVAIATIGAIVYGFLPKPRLVEVASARRAPMQVTVEEEGKTRVVDRFVVSAPVDGFSRRVELKVGDPVSKGQTLVQLEPLRSDVLDPRARAQAEARVSAAAALLRAAEQKARAAKTEAAFAQSDYERVRNLAQQQLASKEQEEQTRTKAQSTAANRRSAEFSVDVARFELQAAKTALAYSAAQDSSTPAEHVTITAPVDGSVLKLYRESEGVVSAGQPLIEVGNARSLEVEVDVLSADAVRIKPGMRVLFDRWGGDEPLQGKVRVVEPAGFTKISALGVEEQRVNIISDFVSDPSLWQSLGDAYRVEASFILWEQDKVLQVPASALFRYKDSWAVFVVENGRAQRRAIKIGHRTGLAAQILDGLKEGETVITHPDDTIEDGVAVEIM
jgi:HlyD family secretion protein